MTAVLVAAAVWFALAIPVAVVIGRALRAADHATRTPPLYVPADWIETHR